MSQLRTVFIFVFFVSVLCVCDGNSDVQTSDFGVCVGAVCVDSFLVLFNQIDDQESG